MAPSTMDLLREYPLGIKILYGAFLTLGAAEAVCVAVLLFLPRLRLPESRVSVMRMHPAAFLAFLLFSAAVLLGLISEMVVPVAISGAHLEFAFRPSALRVGDLFFLLLSLALLPLSRRKYCFNHDGLEAQFLLGQKRFVRWDDIASLDYSGLFGFVLKRLDGRKAYFPSGMQGLASFSEAAATRLTADRMTEKARARISADRARLL